MFTGIIEEIGTVKRVSVLPRGRKIFIKAIKVSKDLSEGDSVSINGVCQTVTGIFGDAFSVEAVGETLEKTTMGDLKPGMKVNLERAVKVEGRLGGHIVLGHVNGVGRIRVRRRTGEHIMIEILIPEALERYVVEEGSITVDGISLTVASCRENTVGLNIIPHTYNTTTLKYKKIGDRINIEVDILSKYLEKIISSNKQNGVKAEIPEKWGYGT